MRSQFSGYPPTIGGRLEVRSGNSVPLSEAAVSVSKTETFGSRLARVGRPEQSHDQLRRRGPPLKFVVKNGTKLERKLDGRLREREINNNNLSNNGQNFKVGDEWNLIALERQHLRELPSVNISFCRRRRSVGQPGDGATGNEITGPSRCSID